MLEGGMLLFDQRYDRSMARSAQELTEAQSLQNATHEMARALQHGDERQRALQEQAHRVAEGVRAGRGHEGEQLSAGGERGVGEAAEEGGGMSRGESLLKIQEHKQQRQEQQQCIGHDVDKDKQIVPQTLPMRSTTKPMKDSAAARPPIDRVDQTGSLPASSDSASASAIPARPVMILVGALAHAPVWGTVEVAEDGAVAVDAGQ